MSYRYTVSAVTHIGDSPQSVNELFFADRLVSLNNGICTNSRLKRVCTGRKHIFAVCSQSHNYENVVRVLSDSLEKSGSDKVRIKIQYDIKNTIESIYSHILDESDRDDADLSVLYIEGDNIYVAGYGDVCIYRYSKKTKTCTKLNFSFSGLSLPLSDSSDAKTLTKLRLPPRSKCIGTVSSGDEYLLVGGHMAQVVGDKTIEEILIRNHSDSAQELIDTACDIDSSSNYAAVHISVDKSRKKALIFILAALIAVLSLALTTLLLWGNLSDATSTLQTDPFENSAASAAEEVSETIANSALTDSYGEFSSPNSMDLLKEQLDAIGTEVIGTNSVVSYYVKNLSNNEVIESNNSRMYSASLIKLFIMAEIYRMEDEGALTIDGNIQNLLTQMITVSDNDASNELASIAGNGDMQRGFANITQNAINLGCQYTQQKNDLQAVRTVPIEPGNFTSVRDCGMILEKIYKGELVSSDASEEMLSLLKKQQRRLKIPKYLPSDTIIANKTGETSTAQNDVGIIYTDEADYIICIMISNYGNSMDATMDIVARMSKAAYDNITQVQ